MDRKQASFTVIALGLVLIGMAGLYYGLYVIYQTYQAKTAPGTIGGTLQNLIGG